jgi:hypothetical protein
MITVETVIQVLMALPALIKTIKELMALAQAEFGKGTGPEKKDVVLSGVASVINNDAVWARVQSMFSLLIDALALFKPKTNNA